MIRILAVAFFVCVAFAAQLRGPILPTDAHAFLRQNPSALQTLTDNFSSFHNLNGLNNAAQLLINLFAAPTPLPDAASYLLWFTNVNQTGYSRFILGAPGPRNTNFATPWVPVRTIIRQSTQEWYTADAVAGQYTGPNYSLIWTTAIVGGVPVTFCLANTTAGFLNQQSAHNTAFLLNTTVAQQVDLLNIPLYRPVYQFDGLTNDFGGTSNGTMDFWGNFDKATFTPYYFGFSQPTVTGKPVYGPGACPHDVGVVSGEYNFADGGRFFPVTSASIINLVPAACRVGGSPTGPIDPYQLPSVDYSWCGN
jgi:hypothetical protein